MYNQQPDRNRILMKSTHKITLLFLLAVFVTLLFLQLPQDAPSVRGKSPALPIKSENAPENKLAQDIALSSGDVILLTTGKRSEVFDVGAVGPCVWEDCRQVTIYNFDDNTTVIAIVDLVARRVIEVQEQSGMLPPANQRLYDVAVRVIRESDEVALALGYRPGEDEIMPMPSSLAGTDCGSIHPCLGATFSVGDRFLWAHVDLTTETFAGIAWSPAPEMEGEAAPFSTSACPTPGSISRDGWQMDYTVNGSDGLIVREVRFQQTLILKSAKLAEWHVDYGNTGFIDATGCVAGGGQSYIPPFGETEIRDLLDAEARTIGFEIVQDFRMAAWGVSCNYRYEQHYQFFKDGRFRVVAGAFGRGCGTNAEYRPLIRIDLALAAPGNETFWSWDGNQWQAEATELQFAMAEPFTSENYAWKVTDEADDIVLYIEPGLGQLGKNERGDRAFVYVSRHAASEGDADLAAVGACCNNDIEQGPHRFINDESIDSTDLVLWYVPQLLTETTEGSEFCWTVTGGENPETYPCFSGPMFHLENVPDLIYFWIPFIQKD